MLQARLFKSRNQELRERVEAGLDATELVQDYKTIEVDTPSQMSRMFELVGMSHEDFDAQFEARFAGQH